MSLTNPIYSEFAKVEGAAPAQQLGWHRTEDQTRCFDILMGLARDFASPLAGKTVHDAGCGYGHLLPRILAEGAHYIGTDCMADSIAQARRLHPDADFRHLDLISQPIPEADVTIVCGALAFYTSDTVGQMLKRIWASTRETLVFTSWWNLPPDWDNYKDNKKAQGLITDFLRKNGSRRHRVFGYGNKHEGAFALRR